MRASLSLLAWTVAAALLILPRPLAAQTPIPPKLDMLREDSRLEFDQLPLANPGLPVPPSQRAETVTRMKPVVSAGLKAYISPRAFVRGDILLSPWTTSRDVTV